MNKVKLLCGVITILFVVCVSSSVSFGAENLSQSEIDDLISRVEKGDPEAQFQLGEMYYDGKNVKQNYEQAFYWFKKVAEKGDAAAQYNVGLMYRQGKGVNKDYEQAAYWYKKAAEQGLAKAQSTLGQMYADGEGVQQDHEQAIYWARKAAEQGLEIAKIQLEVYERSERRRTEQFKSTTSASEPQAQQSTSGKVIEVSIEQLFREYKENTFAANLRYKDKKVRVSGTIIGINEVLDEICIALRDKNKKDLYCYFDKSETDSIIQLKNGQNVIIEGTSNENLILGVTLNNCRVISSIQAQNQNTTSSYQQPAPSTVAVATLSKPSNFDEAKGNAVIFLNSLEEVAEKLIATDTYNVQDIEVMPADEYREESETVYMRAWYNEKYFMFSNYANSPRPVACFRTYSPEHVFAGGIKVGSSFNEIRYLFGDSGSWNAEDNTLYVNVDSSEANIHFNSGRVDYIEYEYMGAEYTHKMMNLLYLYRDDIWEASVTTDSRLNVRDTNGTHGNILFQVTKQNNILFVDKDSSNGWYRVRFVYDKSANTISSVNEGYVMGKYINLEPLGYGDRQSLITVFSK